MLNNVDFMGLFGQVQRLLVASLLLKTDLQYLCMQDWKEDDSRVGHMLCEYYHDMRDAYMKYASCFEKCQRVMKRLYCRQSFQRILLCVEKRKEINRMTLEDFIIAPMQRITRYGLLIKDLAKHTPLDHVDYDYINLAKRLFNDIAGDANNLQSAW